MRPTGAAPQWWSFALGAVRAPHRNTAQRFARGHGMTDRRGRSELELDYRRAVVRLARLEHERQETGT